MAGGILELLSFNDRRNQLHVKMACLTRASDVFTFHFVFWSGSIDQTEIKHTKKNVIS